MLKRCRRRFFYGNQGVVTSLLVGQRIVRSIPAEPEFVGRVTKVMFYAGSSPKRSRKALRKAGALIPSSTAACSLLPPAFFRASP